MTQSPYQSNDAEELIKLASAADVYLQAQLSAAMAADQRALVFAGFLAAAIAAIAGSAASVLTGNSIDHFLGKTGVLTGLGLLIGLICAVIAARPTRWYFPGSQPSNWQEDFRTGKPQIERLQELLADYSHNHATMRANGRWITGSAVVTIATLAASGVALAAHVF